MKRYFFVGLAFFLFACKSKVEKIQPELSSITESIYASGKIRSENQYQAYVTVSGIISTVFVREGDSVKIGDPILSVFNEAQKLNKANAAASSVFSDYNANIEKLREGKSNMDMAQIKMKNDSVLLVRQRNLWAQQVGTKVELEQREIAYDNTRTNYYASMGRYLDLKRQLNYNSDQAKRNLQISERMEADYTLRSEVNGVVYSLLKKKGELVNPQAPAAIVGDSRLFVLEMQVDEFDITRIQKDMLVLVSMDSYKGQVFEARVSKINPIMNERSKSFLVEAVFVKQPDVLFPNISFEANILVRTKEKVLLIPRNYLVNDSMVMKANGEMQKVETGLKDYQKIEIISGLSENDELIKAQP